MSPGRPPGRSAGFTVPQALQQALAALQRGEVDTAGRLCREVLAAKADSFEAAYFLGIIAGQAGRPEEAEGWFARAVAANPRHPDAHFNHGVALAGLGRHEQALAGYDRALALSATHADAWHNRGIALAALGRHAEAIASYDRVLALDPRSAEAHYSRGAAMAGLGRFEEAIQCQDRAIALRPQHAGAHNNKGVFLSELGDAAAALQCYERAIALRPGFANAIRNRGIALADLDRPAEALASFDEALALHAGDADAWYNRGNALRELGRHREAIASFERAIAIDPAHASAHWNLADCLLLLGEFTRGWSEYEWRWRLPRRGAPRRFAGDPWLGDRPLAGKTIVLHGELGLGDTLQFCRYAPLVASLGARVVLQAQAPLVPLLQTLAGVEAVIAMDDPLPHHDEHCPLMSLPLAFRTQAVSIPAAIPYLHAAESRSAQWADQLPDPGRMRVGVVWSGSRGLRHDKRSMALADALPLFDSRVQWVSLQKERSESEATALERSGVLDLGPRLRDFADTAAVVQQIDLLVTVDTSIAHVAGALGRPVWILLPLGQHDWRWQLDRPDSPWYPTARLFRQHAPGDWGGVLARVREALASAPRAA